jgi:very-short-patch-repair endonuclease
MDFCCVGRRLVVELDGGQHVAAAAADQRRTRWLKRRGFRVARFWNDDVLARCEAVVAEIVRAIDAGL